MQTDENSSNRGKPQAAAYSLGAERIDGRNSSESFSNYPSTVKFQNTPSQFTGYYRGSRYPQNVEEYDAPELLDADINEGAGRRIKYADFTTIDWLHDLAKDRVRVKILRSQTGLKGYLTNLYDAGQGWIIVALVGVFSGLFAGFITLSSEWLNDLKVGYCEDVWYLNRRFCCWQEPFDECVRWKRWNESSGFTGFIMYLMFAVSFACISAVLVQQYAPYAAGSGIPEVKTILNGYIMRKFLGWFTLIIKAVGLSLSVASGLSLGKEGPLVHVACCLGNIFPRIFTKYASNEARKREILSASAAAGVSVAFGAPIGGILFSLEEVSYYFPYKTLWRSFFCATIAAVSLQIVNPLRTNQLVLFQITYARPWQSFELVIYALLGVFGGLYGAFFVKMNLAVNKFRKTTEIRKWPVLEVVLICAATAILSYPHAYSRMNTSELVSLLFRDCEGSEYQEFCNPEKYTYVIGFTLLVCIIKILTTVFTFGVRVPAGIFIPSLAVGACFGRIVGSLVQLVYLAHPDWSIFSKCLKEESCINPGTYAMVGAAATLGGVTRMTVSLVVIMFELTGALTYVLPTMLAVLVSKWIGDYFGKGSIYEGLIELNGYPFLDHQHQPVVSTTVDQNMTHADQLNVVTAHDETVASLSALLEETSYKGYPVVDNRANMTLLGYIGRNEIEYVLMSTRRIRMLPEDTPCLFASKSSGTTNRGENSIPPTPAVPKLHNPSFPSTSDASLPYLENNLQLKTNASVHHDETAGRVDFRPWVDQTPVTVQPKMSMDFVLDLFRDLGLRYVIIINNGKIGGLLTKKDMLSHVVLKHD